MQSGQAWTPDLPDEAHLARHFATYGLVRDDGFRLRIARHGSQGVASVDEVRLRSHIVLDRRAPIPFHQCRTTHVFNLAKGTAEIAAEFLAM